MAYEYNFDDAPHRQHTDSVKFDRYADSDILPMWVADMDFPVAPEISDAISARLEHPIYGYTHVPESLNALIVERMQRLYHWSIKPEWLVWIPGVVAAVNIACRSLGESNSRVLSPAVVYPHIPEAPELNYHRLVQVPMVLQNNRWVMDLAWIATQSHADDKML